MMNRVVALLVLCATAQAAVMKVFSDSSCETSVSGDWRLAQNGKCVLGGDVLITCDQVDKESKWSYKYYLTPASCEDKNTKELYKEYNSKGTACTSTGTGAWTMVDCAPAPSLLAHSTLGTAALALALLTYLY